MSDDRDDLRDRLDDVADELDSEPDIEVTCDWSVVTQKDVDNGDGGGGDVVTVTRNPAGGE